MAHRAYIFTYNNFTTTEINWASLEHVRYASWQHERVGHDHLQGYVELRKPQRLSYFRELLPGAHWEPRRGSREQARDYTRKDDSRIAGPFEFGEWELEQGRRTDIERLKGLLDTGATELEIMEAEFGLWIRNYRAIERYKLLKTVQRSWKTEVTILVGPPGCGKSKYCLDNCANAYWKENSKWWDGYQAQEDVVIDDFYGWLPWTTLLRLCDRYPLNLETKGGTVVFQAKRIFITSNSNFDQWYKNVECDPRALKRRITHYYSCDIIDGVQTLVNKDSLLA